MVLKGAAKRAHLETLEQTLQEAGLSHCLAALKGSEGAVQLHHVKWLKQRAQAGRVELEAALLEAGIADAADRTRLSTLLLERLEVTRGLRLKPLPQERPEGMSEAWRVELSDAEGQLHPELRTIERPADGHDGVADGEADEPWPPGMQIVNGHMAHSIRAQQMLREPNAYGYIHLAAEVERPRLVRKPGKEKAALLEQLKAAAAALVATDSAVQRADVFNAFLIPPGTNPGFKLIEDGNYDIHIAEFDIAVLVECSSTEAAVRVRKTEAFEAVKALLDRAARFVHCTTASNPKRIAEVDRSRDGVFLFNYFFAADIEAKGASGVDILLGVWEYTAGWWTAKANLTNSTPLLPLPGESSCYSLVNHCRWDRMIDLAPHLIFRPTLNQFVIGNFTANDIAAMPILYHLA